MELVHLLSAIAVHRNLCRIANPRVNLARDNRLRNSSCTGTLMGKL